MSDTLSNNTCERCRIGTTSPVTLDAVHSDDGASVTYSDTFMRCDHCEREFYTTEQSQAQHRAITAALRKRDGFLSAGEIKLAREQYGLSLPEFEKALGVGKNTVGRWERGTVPPASAANFGLWMARYEPVVFERYASTRGVVIRKRPQHATSAMAETEQHPTARANAHLKLVKATRQESRSIVSGYSMLSQEASSVALKA